MKHFALVFFVCVVVLGCSQIDKINKSRQVIELGLPTLANDVATGSLLYEEKTVKIRGLVAFGSDYHSGKKFEIRVPVRNVYLSIYQDESKKQDLSQYERGETYTFTVYIRKIKPGFSSDTGKTWFIQCTLVK